MPIQIESRVDPEYDGIGDRVFVVSALHDVSERFGEPAEQFIVEHFERLGWHVLQDVFREDSPIGEREFSNIGGFCGRQRWWTVGHVARAG